MAPFDRSYTTFYRSAIVSIALSCTTFNQSINQKGIRVTKVTNVTVRPLSSYLALNNIVTLKSGLQVTQGH